MGGAVDVIRNGSGVSVSVVVGGVGGDISSFDVI
jgi:hypothetical protein